MFKYKPLFAIAGLLTLGLAAISCGAADTAPQPKELDAPLQGSPEVADQETAPALSAAVAATCPASAPVEVGQYATWWGKVNVHTVGAGWAVDSDCVSGANLNTVSYCQKFWPTAKTQVAITPTSALKPFMTAGCAALYPSKGVNQYACCAGAPCTWNGTTYPDGTGITAGAICSAKFEGTCIGGVFAGDSCVASGQCYARCSNGTWVH